MNYTNLVEVCRMIACLCLISAAACAFAAAVLFFFCRQRGVLRRHLKKAGTGKAVFLLAAAIAAGLLAGHEIAFAAETGETGRKEIREEGKLSTGNGYTQQGKKNERFSSAEQNRKDGVRTDNSGIDKSSDSAEKNTAGSTGSGKGTAGDTGTGENTAGSSGNRAGNAGTEKDRAGNAGTGKDRAGNTGTEEKEVQGGTGSGEEEAKEISSGREKNAEKKTDPVKSGTGTAAGGNLAGGAGSDNIGDNGSGSGSTGTDGTDIEGTETGSTEDTGAGAGNTAGGAGETGSGDAPPDETAPLIRVAAENTARTDTEGTVYLRADNAALKVRISDIGENDRGLGNCYVTVSGESGEKITRGAAWTAQGQEMFEVILERKSITALGDGEIDVRITAEDIAGNRSESEEKFILDTCSPVLRFDVNQPVGNDASLDPKTGIVYYGADRGQYEDGEPEILASFTVKDENIRADLLSCRYIYLTAGAEGTESGGNINTEHDCGESNGSSGDNGLGESDGSAGNKDFAGDKDSTEDNGSMRNNEFGKSGPKRCKSTVRKTIRLHPGEKDCPDGGYRFLISGTDLAGNPLRLEDGSSTEPADGLCCTNADDGSYESGIKIIDTKPPTAVLTASSDDVFYRVEIGEGTPIVDRAALHPYQSASEAVMRLAGEDESPVQLSWKLRSTDGTGNDMPGGGGLSEQCYQTNREEKAVIRGDQIFWAENISVRDRAGNTSCTLSATPRLYLDTVQPSSDLSAPSATVRATGEVTAREADGRPLFGSSVILQIHASDPASQMSGTGLQKVTCDVWAGERHIIRSRNLYSADSDGESGTGESVSGQESGFKAGNEVKTDFHTTVTIPAGGSFESNRIRVEVHASDRAGNSSDLSGGGTCRFGIDTQGPEVTVTFENEEGNTVHNGQYFAGPRSAVIHVRDRNPGDGTVRVMSQGAAVSKWQSVRGRDPDGSLDEKICMAQWQMDGDYTLEVSGTDALGNPASVKYEGEAAQAFTIDRTPPVIEVKWSEADTANTGYYNRPRAARVRIRETNFSARGLRITSAGTAPMTGMSWQGTENTDPSGISEGYWEGVVIFRDEGEWRLACTVTDLAGNAAVPYSSDTFVIDMTPPLLYFDEETVTAGGAYAGVVTPRVLYSDENLESGSLQVRTERCIRCVSEEKDPREKREEQDLHWEYESLTDHGGSILFDDAAHDREKDGLWFCEVSVRDLAGNCSRVRRQYCLNRYGSVYDYTDGSNSKALLQAYYIDTDEPIEITEYAGSRLISKRVTLYRNGEGRRLSEGKEYRAEQVKAGSGYSYRYVIQPSSFAQDGIYALTLESEDSAGHRNSSAADLHLRWAVDRTAPTCGLSGLREGQARYQTDELTVKILPADDLGLSSVTVRTRSDDGRILKEETYTGEKLETALLKNGNGIPFKIEASDNWQTLEAETADDAGNMTEMDSRRVLVTSNPLVHIYRSGIIPAIALVTAAVAVSIMVFHSSFTKTL